MIDQQARPMAAAERYEKPQLAPVLCALCGHPVSHMTRVSRSMAGGMCMNDSCVKDKRTRKPRQVFTFNRLVDEL